MKNVRICSVVRFYDELGDYREKRYDNISCGDVPKDIMRDLVSGEVVCVKIAPNVEAFYFKKPEDWPENWTELGTHNMTE
jgi:hypothetical protein